MATIETDYLVVGAGASAMAFTDTLIDQTDDEVVLVDRRHRPGGHWVDSYPFVRLHQPAAWYGVGSRELYADHMDIEADRAGLASGTEVCEYYLRVLEDHFLPSGQVRWLPKTDWCGGADGTHELRSVLTGETTTVKVRKKLVDARFPELSIPSRHTPGFTVDPEARLLPPNDLVDLDRPASGYTVLGGGKTSMDTCYWLLEQGVPADKIRWVRPRESWLMDRERFLPSEDGSSFLELNAEFLAAAAAAASVQELTHNLEDVGVFHRFDSSIEPEIFRGATVSRAEADVLRQIEDVVRMGKVVHIGADEITLSEGAIPTDREQVHVDCTARGVGIPTVHEPIFRPGLIDTNTTTFGNIPWSSALIGYVEANRDDDAAKNRLCPVIPFTGEVDSLPASLLVLLQGQGARMAEPDLAAWEDALRLNPANGSNARMDQPAVQSAMARMFESMGPAMENMSKLVPG